MMNFQHSPPLLIKHINKNRVIVLTKYRIMYMSIGSNIPFVASTLLVEHNPLQLQYSKQRDQTIVVTQSSIQVYCCDFVHQQIQLKKCIILNQQTVYSIRSNGLRQWQLFGQIYQYSNNFIKIHSIQSKSYQEQNQLIKRKCFVEEFQIYISNKGLILNIYDHIKEIQGSISLEKGSISLYNIQSTQQLCNYLKQTSCKQCLRGWKLNLSKSNNNIFNKQQQNILSSQEHYNQYRSQILPYPKQPSSINNIDTNLNNNNNNNINMQRKSNHVRHFSYSLTDQNNNYLNKQSASQQQFVLLVEIDKKYLIALIPPYNQYNMTYNNITIPSILNKSNKHIQSTKLQNNTQSIKNTLNSKLRATSKWQPIYLPLSNISNINNIFNKNNLQSYPQYYNQKQRSNKLLRQRVLFSSIYTNLFSVNSGQYHFIQEQNKYQQCLILLTKLQQEQIKQQRLTKLQQRQIKLQRLTKRQQKQIKQQRKIKPKQRQQFIYLIHIVRLQNTQINNQLVNQIGRENINQKNIRIFPNNQLNIETYKIQLQQQPIESSNDIIQVKQFLQLLSSSNPLQSKDKNHLSTNTVQLTNIQSSTFHQQQYLQLTFSYYNYLIKTKTLSSVKLNAKRLLTINQSKHTDIDHSQNPFNKNTTTSIFVQSQKNNKYHNNQNQGKGLFTSMSQYKNTKNDIKPQLNKFQSKQHNHVNKNENNENKESQNYMFQNVPLTISQSITQSRPITTSQPITIKTSQPITIALTYSSELTNTQILSKKPSSQSNNFNKTQYLNKKDNQINIIDDKNIIEGITSIQRNRSQNYSQSIKNSKQNDQQLINKNKPNSSQQNSKRNQYNSNRNDQRLNQLRVMAHLCPQHITIPQLSQEQYNQQTTKFQMQQIQQIVQMKDFKPTTFSNKILTTFPNKILTTSQIHKHDQQQQFQSQNQTQQKQFYRKFINHIPPNNNNIDDSQQSFDKNFKLSKASAQDLKKDTITKMIGGKDISQIGMNIKNLSLNTDQQMEESLATVQLGQEIQKKYSINYGVKNSSHLEELKSNHTKEQKYYTQGQKDNKKYGMNSKQQQEDSMIQCDQPTVILVDTLQQQQQYQISQQDIRYQRLVQQNHSEFIDPNIPYTPGFNIDFHPIDHQHILRNPQIGIVSNDHWDNFTKRWSVKAQQQVNQSQQFLHVNDSPKHVSLNDSQFIPKQSTQKVLTQEQFNNLSKKVKQFCSDPQNLTQEEVKQIQNKKYTLLMKQIYLRSQQKFNLLMKEFLAQIIREEQARLFFAQYIRSFSGKTRDILIRLYMSLPQSQQNKNYMSRALSQFKLSQVPQICLPVHKDVLKIFKFLYPSVYIEDLLKPSIGLMQQLLDSYFSLQKLPMDEIVIQDEAIDLSHPRNMLNVLLYLNEHYNLPMTQLFQVYCSVLIKNDCSQIVVKMLREQKTFQICQVPKSILQDIVQNIIIEKLKQSSSNIHWLGKTLQILQCNLSPLSLKKKQRLSLILNTIDYLNLNDCQFNIHSLFLLSQLKNLFIFCNTLIKQNSIINLKKISMQKLYQQLFYITHEQKLIYYNQQLKDLLEILCQKYFQNAQIIKGFQILAPIISISRRGFLGKMLFKYLDGRWLNRLVKKEFYNKHEFIMTFKQCFACTNNSNNGMYSQSMALSHSPRSSRQVNQNPSSSITLLPHDKFQFQPSLSYLLPNCSYFKFFNIFNQCIKSTKSQQVIYVCYCDYQLAQQLATYHVITKKEWQLLNQKLQPYIPKEEIRKLSSKNNFIFDNKLLITDQQNQEDDNHLRFSHSQNMKDPSFLNPSQQQNAKQHLIKSLQSLQHQQLPTKQNLTGKKLNVLRSKSHSKETDQNFKDISHSPLLQSLKYQFNPQTIIKILKKLYQDKYQNYNQKIKNFLKALSMIDRERVHIHHYEKFKIIANLQLDFYFDEFIPFQVLLQQNHVKCFQIIEKNNLKDKLYLWNFWAVYMIIEMLVSQGQNVAVIMIQKLIKQKNVVDLQGIINKIVEGTKISPQKLRKIIKIT